MPLSVPMELFRRFMQVRRRQMFDCVLDCLQPGPGDSCLELGGPIRSPTGITSSFGRYLVLNIDLESMRREAAALPHYRDASLILGDATAIPLQNGAVDFVVANALLEHIMPPAQRPQFVREVLRVARKGYFISAPNYWFPLEPHYYMPFFQFLPESLKRWLSWRVRMGWMHKESYVPVSLPTKRELRRLLPAAHITGLSFTHTIPETIIAWQRFEQE